MGMSPFPDEIFVKTLDTAEEPVLGAYTFPDEHEFAHVQIRILVHGTIAGNERLRLNVYNRPELNGIVARSEWVNVADFVGGTYWLDLVRFDFPRTFVNANTYWFLSIETENYTRNADLYYISVVSDWPVATNVPEDSFGYFAAAAHFFGYRGYD